MQRFGDQTFAHFGAVRVRGVDQIDSELHRASQYGDRRGVIPRLAPHSLTRDLHGSEAEALHRQISAQHERAAPGGRGQLLRAAHFHFHLSVFSERDITQTVLRNAGFRRAADFLDRRYENWNRGKCGGGRCLSQRDVPAVAAHARFRRPAQAIGAEAEAQAALRTTGRAAGRHHTGPGEGPAHLCLKVMRPRVRS